MKYLIFSDLHGDWQKAEAILHIFQQEHCEKMIFLGDLLYHGPRNNLPPMYNPKKVVELLKPYGNQIVFIKGNCDAEVDEMVMEQKFLSTYQLTLHSKRLLFVHGHHLSRFEPDLNLSSQDLVVYGHYHTFDVTTIQETKYINIGSTSIPKDQHAGYALLDDKSLIGYDFMKKELLKIEI